MAIVENSGKSKWDAKKGIDGKKGEARRAVVDRIMRAKMIAGRRRAPRRGDIVNGIVKGAVKRCIGPLEKLVNKPKRAEVASRRPGKKQQAVPAQPSGDAKPFTSPSLALVMEPKRRSSSVESPENHISVTGETPWTTSSKDADLAIPFPTKSVAMAKLWAEVDVSNALVHDGSVLYKEGNGKWTAMELCPDDAPEIVPPSTKPDVQIAAAILC